MAQELELIVEMLREMQRANSANSASFDKLLSSISKKIDVMDKNSASTDLIKAYLGELAKSLDEKYSKTLDKFSAVENALKAVYNRQDDNIKTKDIQELFEIFSKNMNSFYTEAKQQKALLSTIEMRLSEISSNKSDKEDILRTITLLRNDFENLNYGYKSTIDKVNSDLKSILNALIKSNQSALITQVKEQVDILYTSIKDMVNFLSSIDKRETRLESLLESVATSENLKLTQGLLDSLIEKSDRISEKITTLADKSEITELQDTASIMNKKLDDSINKKTFNKLTQKTEALINQTDEIKQNLANITKDIDNLPDTTIFEHSLQNLYAKLSSLGDDINNANTKADAANIENQLSILNDELNVIKNIVIDLNDIVSLRVIQAINDINFIEESSDLKAYILKMLETLPQKEDINRILENNELSKKSYEYLINKTDIIADKLDSLPTHKDMTKLNSSQLELIENLQGIAHKDDIEQLAVKADEIEHKIDKLNFDDEFGNLYDRTSSLEKWLVDSKIKENTEELTYVMQNKAAKKDVIEILESMSQIIDSIEELSRNTDVKKVNRTVSEVYQILDDLKNDFITTTDMHNDSVIVQLSELQNVIADVTKGEDFDRFKDDLTAFIEKIVNDNTEFLDNFNEIKNYQENILEQLKNINITSIENQLLTISDYLANINQNKNPQNIQFAIDELKEILANKKSNFNQIDSVNNQTITNIENYLKEIKVILDTSDKNIDGNTALNFSKLEEELQSYHSSNENAIVQIIERIDELQNSLALAGNPAPVKEELKTSIAEITELQNRIRTLGNSFNQLNYSEGSTENNISTFVYERLTDLSANLEDLSKDIESNLQSGFAYNAELIEEKTAVLLDLIKELRHNNTENIELFERLTVTDNKLFDFKQELELINTDVISTLNSKTDQLLEEFAPIKEMLIKLSGSNFNDYNQKIKNELDTLYENTQEDLIESTKYSKSTFDRLEASYEQISKELSATENNIKDFILNDMDSIILKIDELRESIEENLSQITPPDAELMVEFKEFVEGINSFKQEQKVLLKETADDIKESISLQMNMQHDELKSILTVALNNEEIINAIEDLKKNFATKINEIKAQSNDVDEFAQFDSNQYEKAFEVNADSEILNELKEDFNNFAQLIQDLSGENREIKEVLNVIKAKMERISVIQGSNTTPTNIETIDATDSSELVGDGNFNFVKALNFLQHDIQKLNSNVESVIPAENKKEVTSNLISSSAELDIKSIQDISKKLERITQVINPQEWLDEIKNYIAGDEIHTMLQEINEKIDILTLSENSEWLGEIKQALTNINIDSSITNTDPQIQSMLELINEKIDIIAATDESDEFAEIKDSLDTLSSKVDIIASTDDSGNFEDIIGILENIQTKIENVSSADEIATIKKTLNKIEKNILNLQNDINSDSLDEIKEVLDIIEHKIDTSNANETLNNIEDIKYTLLNVDEKIDTVKTLTESDKGITSKLEILDSKIDVIADTTTYEEIEEIKQTLLNVDQKVDSINKLSESDAKITSILELLNHKIDIIADNENSLNQKDFQDIKDLIMAQMDYIDSLEKSNKTDAVKKCLKELTIEVNNLNSNDSTKQIQKTIKDMKESIMAAVVSVFEQISFVEESEDIKDFVEEKTDAINQSLALVTDQLRQITNANEEPDYTYSMQDIESDLAKLRLVLNELQTNEQENNSVRLASILENINQIGNSVEDLQNSLTKEEVFGLRIKFDRINTDIKSLNALTNQLIVKSSESYNALNNTFEDFGKIITSQLSTKVDRVTKLLETSHVSDKVMRQALIYMGEWIDSASASMNKISTNSDEIIDIKSAIDGLKKSVPEQTDILNSIEEKFDEQQERLAYFEKQISKLGGLEDKFEEQQERIDRLEMTIEKILSAVEDIDDSKVTRKIDKIDKQIAKLSTNIEKLASYVD